MIYNLFIFLLCGDRELREMKRKVDREEIKNKSHGELARLERRTQGVQFFSKRCQFNSN